MKKPLIILTGPTAVGKTKLSLSLAHAVNGAIISADSMQVYRHMTIGSAKILPEEMQGIPHYLVDILDPSEEFHVVRFLELAHQAMDEIYANGQIPIVTGGTGFYIQALLKEVDFSETQGELPIRKEWERMAKEKEGPEKLHKMLENVDPDSAAAIHPHNVKRVIRALEFYEETGSPISGHNEREKKKESPYQYAYFVLNDDRAKLYRQIEERVDRMMQAGLLQEVRKLKEMGYSRSLVSMQGLGYKELFAYLEGECTLESAIDIIKRDTRHFAKRQLTWFRREPDVIWVNKPDFHWNEEEILHFILQKWKEKQQEEQESC